MGSMKAFYFGLAGVAVLGVGALLLARSGASSLPVEPLSTAAIEAARGFGGYTMGTEDAPVEVIEYGDFQCPACKQFWVLTMPDAYQRLINTGKVRWVFMDFPLDSHAHARLAHHAAACVAEQGLFWPMHDRLYEMQEEWSFSGRPASRMQRYAQDVGADVDRYDECMEEGRYRAQIQASYEHAVSAGIRSTPSFIIGNRVYTGAIAYDPLKAIVDSLTALAAR